MNDTHGHATGDEVLSIVARVVSQVVRTEDVVGRWGGEEFVVALPGTCPEGAAAWLRRLIAEGQASSHGPVVTFSAGVTVAPHPDSIQATIAEADEALYRAKGAGRATVIVV